MYPGAHAATDPQRPAVIVAGSGARLSYGELEERSLRENYTKQFRDVVAASDPGSIMTSYNRVNGEPTSASPHLMDTLARKTFGFGG